MTEEEYKKELAYIDEQSLRSKKDLVIKYAMENAKFKIGDIIRDGSETILVEKIKASQFMGLPDTVYVGKALKKDLSPKKSGESNTLYQRESTVLVKSAL